MDYKSTRPLLDLIKPNRLPAQTKCLGDLEAIIVDILLRFGVHFVMEGVQFNSF